MAAQEEGVSEATAETKENDTFTARPVLSSRIKYLTLKAKCEQMDQSNDVLYSKSRQIQKMIQRAEAEKRMLMRRLEQYVVVDSGIDSHVTEGSSPLSPSRMAAQSSLPRSVFTSPTPDPSDTGFVQNLKNEAAPLVSPPSSNPPPPSLPPPSSVSASTSRSSPHLSLPPPNKKQRLSTPTRQTTNTTSSSSSTKSKKGQRGSTKGSPATRRKKDHDAGAPKKPSNAFFWFCQEQRGSLEDQFRGEGVAGQHSLTKILAQKWGETNNDDRKIYYQRYTEDKKRYERELLAYQQKKHEQQQILQEQQQQQSTS